MRRQLVAELWHILGVAVQTVDNLERLGGVFVDNAGGEVEQIVLVRKSRGGTHNIVVNAPADCEAPVHKRQRVAHCAVGNRGDKHCGAVCKFCVLFIGNVEQSVGNIARRDTVKVKPLTARLNCEQNLVNLGGRQNKHNVLGRLLEDFKQGVERLRRKHMNLVDYIYAVLAPVRRGLNLVDDLAYAVDFAV